MNTMTKTTAWLNRDECAALRGLAIMAIMLHNYCHWLGFAVKENEYTFNAANTARLWDAMFHADANLPIHLLSYFGHYGVPVFLFLSGFGLVMKYERRPQELPAWRFARYHYMKLLRMMVPGFVAFIIVDAITPGPFRFQAENVVAQMLMAINLLPAPDRIIWPGPYWFFGLMMQLYIVYRLALYRRHWAWAAALVALCWAAQAACSPMGETLNRLRYNCIGGMLVFCAGLLAARHLPAARLNAMGRPSWAAVSLVSAAMLLACCTSFQAWLWAPLAVVAASVGLVKALPAAWLSPLSWLGGISAAMFVAHPLLRKVFIPISRRGDIYDGLLLYVIATVAVSWMFMIIINRIPKPKA